MTITNTWIDVHYPFAGDTVTVNATFDAGTRYRVRLVSKPYNSALEVYDEAKDNHLPLNRLTPDVGGRYELLVVEELVQFDPPRFSNDFGDASARGGSATLSRGVEQVTEHGTATLVLTAGERVTRNVGLPPDAVVFEAHAHQEWKAASNAVPSAFGGDPLGSDGYGVLTAVVDAAKAPRLILDGASSVARTAATDTSVAQALRDLGGAPLPSLRYGTRYGEQHPIMTWNRVIEADPIGSFGWLVQRLNRHIGAIDLSIHQAADTGVGLISPMPADQVTFLNDLRVKLLVHVQSTTAHKASDVLTAQHIPTSDLALSASQDACCDRTNLLWWCLDEHLTRLYPSSANNVGDTNWVHLYGDLRLDASKYPLAVDAGTAAARQQYMWKRYKDHWWQTDVDTSGVYHSAAASASDLLLDSPPTDRESYIESVGKAWAVFRQHVSNRNVSGVVTAYHASPDAAASASMLGNPSNFAEAIVYHEALNWALGEHAAKGNPTHSCAYAGGCRPSAHGIEALHHAYRSALLSATGTTPPNANVASSKLVMLGGFTKDAQ